MTCLKTNFIFFFLIVVSQAFGQEFSDAWKGHYSYLEIKDITNGTDKFYAAAENALFTYDVNTNVMETISTIEGISGEVISSILYIEDESLVLIGFENGLMQVYDEANRSFLTVVDIIEKPTIPPNDKKINHFTRDGDLVYIATDYGISVYNINSLEFGDTYYIGPNGSQLKVTQTTIFEGNLYASTEQSLYRADLLNPNLIDYNQWESFRPGNWVGIQAVADKIYVARSNRRVYELNNIAISQVAAYTRDITGFKNIEDNLVVTTLPTYSIGQI